LLPFPRNKSETCSAHGPATLDNRAFGVIDLAYVRWQFSRQKMMSRREVKLCT
jgi:hypothetical protein